MRKRFRRSIILAVAAGLIAVPLTLLSTPEDSSAAGLPLRRIAANTLGFASDIEAGTSDTISSPVTFYNRTLDVPGSLDIIYVTVAGSGSTVNGSPALFNCMVDGVNCTDLAGSTIPDPEGFSVPAGWIALLRNPDSSGFGRFRNNSFKYTWCTKIEPGGPGTQPVNVKLKLASRGIGNDSVSIEGLTVTVDANRIKNSKTGCVNLDPAPL